MVTYIKHRTALLSYSDEQMHAALDINLPNYASAILRTKSVDRLPLSSL